MEKRIKFEATKSQFLVIHRVSKVRREVKNTTLYLDREHTQPISWVEHLKLLESHVLGNKNLSPSLQENDKNLLGQTKDALTVQQNN